MKLTAGCYLKMKATISTPTVFMLKPRNRKGQFVLNEEYILSPQMGVNEFTDSFGNLCQRLTIPAGEFTIKTEITVDTADDIVVNFNANTVPVDAMPEDILQFLLPSRYCQSDKNIFNTMALSIAKGLPEGYQQVEAIRLWIRDNITYAYNTSDASTSAVDTLQTRTGVCRDYAHLGIAFCRSLNIPARMVVGYLHQLKPMDLHAWFEVYLEGGWYIFDATQAVPMGNRISLAYGRDATDVALATHFGFVELLEMDVWVGE